MLTPTQMLPFHTCFWYFYYIGIWVWTILCCFIGLTILSDGIILCTLLCSLPLPIIIGFEIFSPLSGPGYSSFWPLCRVSSYEPTGVVFPHLFPSERAVLQFVLICRSNWLYWSIQESGSGREPPERCCHWYSHYLFPSARVFLRPVALWVSTCWII